MQMRAIMLASAIFAIQFTAGVAVGGTIHQLDGITFCCESNDMRLRSELDLILPEGNEWMFASDGSMLVGLHDSEWKPAGSDHAAIPQRRDAGSEEGAIAPPRFSIRQFGTPCLMLAGIVLMLVGSGPPRRRRRVADESQQ